MTELLTRLQTTLDNAFRLERELARGGMSLLFLANRGLAQPAGRDQGAPTRNGERRERRKAIEMYQKFIDALEDGDETVQPMVERARRALAALRGEAYPPVDR